ncbi:MAG: hypothetical protein LUD17_00835 [Bacteroidales bacterium]|nr:hypothetical protein [Bacteroidales bacterium]
MTKVTYMAHCGYIVTLDDVVFVFDYVHDPSHALKKTLEQNPDKPVIFFITHQLVNNNHFNPGNFEMAQNHRRVYVVSNSVPADLIPSTLEVAGMSAGDIVEDLPGNIKVQAYKTTEKGVCFVVSQPGGIKMLHAGELNLWDLPDETGRKEYNRDEERYCSIVKRIADDYPELDIAMMNVNPRISLDYAQGARELCKRIKIKDFFPMDIDGDTKEACDFDIYLPEGTTVHCLHVPGQSVNL